MLRVGLIGLGGIGAVHAECWLALADKVRLVAVADTCQEKAYKYADKAGARLYADGMELLEKEELDIVDICVPTFLHAEYVLQAAKHVKNIMVEKPVCLKESEAVLLLEAQEKTGARIQVGHVVRFTAPYKYLKEVVSSGKYGSVVTGHFSRISPRPIWMKGHDDINRTGTMALDMHIHDADFIRYMMNAEPETMESWGTRDKDGIIQHIWTSYRYGEAMLIAEASWDYPTCFPFAATFRVKLEQATIVLDEKGVITVYPAESTPFSPTLEPPVIMNMGINVSDMGPYLNEIKYFLDTIINDTPEGIASLSEAIGSFRMVRKELDLVPEL